MSTDLRELMTERAERLAPPLLDTAAIMAAGDGRVRRRRYAGIAGAAVLAVAAAVAVPAVLGGDGGDARVAELPADREDPIAWVRGSVLHTSPDGPTIDLAEFGLEPVAMVQGDSGYVLAEADGSVHVVLDDQDMPLQVGRVEPGGSARFESDGDVVAWIDVDLGEPAYAVMDLAEGPGLTLLPVRRGRGAALEREPAESVAAVDGRTVYLEGPAGAHVWYPFSGEDETEALPVAEGTSVVLEDVKDGVFHYLRRAGAPGAKEEAYVVGPDLSSGVEVESWDGILSPDGRHLVSETADVNVVSDTTTGERLPFDIGEYAFLAGYRWLDDDTYAALAMKDVTEETVDLLRCEVGTGSCEPVVTGEDLADARLVLPFGEGW